MFLDDEIEEYEMPAVTTEFHSDDEQEGDDHIEFILLDCFQKLHEIPLETFDHAVVRENIQSLYSVVASKCNHSGCARIASLYYIKKNMTFQELRLCHYCFSQAQTCLKELVELDPFHSFVGFFASIGSVLGYYRFVLIT